MRHHELCFGCGRTNLFGLLLDVAEVAPGRVAGRCFIKQDHQGAESGLAHEGVLAAALSDAMALACGADARARELTVRLVRAAPVGQFLDVEAEVKADGRATATASVDGEPVASAHGSYGR